MNAARNGKQSRNERQAPENISGALFMPLTYHAKLCYNCDKGGINRMDKRKLSADDIKAIESVINKDDRAEVVPVKDGVKVLRVKRTEIKSMEDK